jgi:putative chitinase
LILNAKFFARLRASLFNGHLSQAQVDGINAIEKAWKKHGDGDRRKLAYLLATAFHETARTMQPVRETLAGTDAKAKEILTKAWRAGKLKWVKADYWSSGFFGRGFVQITHEANYRKAGQKLGVDLVKNPGLALDPAIAAVILVRGCMEGWFTGKKLGDYSTYKQMRRVVNGTDRADMIAGYALSFEAALGA